MGREIKAILIDVDDCLLPTNGELPFRFFDALWDISYCVKEANEGRFPPIGWCSGRDRNYIEAVSFFVGLPNSWSVIESGITLFNPATKDLDPNPALTDEIRKAFTEIRQQRIPQIRNKYPQMFLYPGNEIQITLERKYGFNLTLVECYKTVREELSDLIAAGLVTVHHSQIAVDISPAGIDKASGVRFFAEKIGIGLDEILGIGDSKGDLPMLEIVGQVGCPANATKECKALVKKKGGYISPYSYAVGVGDVISALTSIASLLAKEGR